MKPVKLFACFLFIVFICYSCEFNPSEIPLTGEKEPPPIPSIYIKLTPEMDTLKVSMPVWVVISSGTDSIKIFGLEAKMDGKDVSVIQENRILINTDPFSVMFV